ncbi:oxidoreductase [Sphingomonas abaci]|uniref:NAD(P)-dependent dehydrogenase (Short-subunit alcohol dehydrogenase family) n=1 Tax=Sphingomonas abaci TaxID=237611 RepID=A0A7W7AP22_9SPHN|nr:oxidoreductase [Sphingomonas abaci]MBB4619649.1 NAD(P)-dependent dehydrogenase (short-subunit alcohol dehydrogenase family) [Sphingomonas abaci]
MSWSAADISSQRGRLAVVTGTGGLGFEEALALARAGASVVVAGRNAQKGQEALTRIRHEVPGADIHFGQLDLASLASIKDFSDRMLTDGRSIDLLINNAGISANPERGETQDGFELQLDTNYLGHFALTMRLMPLLLDAKPARVVSLSSTAHKLGRINFDDLQSERSYSAARAYAQSKLAMLMFALELDRRARASGLPLTSVAAHPGIARTSLMENSQKGHPFLLFFSRSVMRLFGQPARDGALPILRAATDPTVKGGMFYGPSGFMEARGSPVEASMSARAKDEVVRRRLWEETGRLTGVDLPAGS